MNKERIAMKEKIKTIIPMFAVIAVVVYLIACLISPAKSASDIWSYIGYAISADTLIFSLYSLWLWRINPFDKTPRLKKYYRGEIYSTYKKAENNGKKEIKVRVLQTMFGVRVYTKTDINNSASVIGNITEENGLHFLYYTYVTNPKTNDQKKNPIQYGTCRMLIENISDFEGKYWTSVGTAGDIVWSESDKQYWEG